MKYKGRMSEWGKVEFPSSSRIYKPQIKEGLVPYEFHLGPTSFKFANVPINGNTEIPTP